MDLNLQAIAEHLSFCPDCANFADTLADLLTTETSAPAQFPEWSLDFLTRKSAHPLWQSTGANLQRLTQSLDLTWSAGELSLSTIDPTSMLTITAPATRAQKTTQIRHIRIPDAIAGYVVELEIRADTKGRTTLVAGVIESASGQVVKGSRLVLADPANPTRIFQRVTGQTRVPLRPGKSLLRLVFSDLQWEIPLNLEVPALQSRATSGGNRVKAN